MNCEDCRICPVKDLCDEIDKIVDERLSLAEERKVLLAIYEKYKEVERAKVINEIFDLADSADMDSTYIYLEFDKDKFNPPFMRTREEVKEWFKNKLKDNK